MLEQLPPWRWLQTSRFPKHESGTYFGFHVLRELQDGVHPRPGVRMVLEVGKNFLGHPLLWRNTPLLTNTCRSAGTCHITSATLPPTTTTTTTTTAPARCGSDPVVEGWRDILTCDPMSWYMELTTLSNKLMSSFWLKSSSCLAGWSANMVISAGIELLTQRRGIIYHSHHTADKKLLVLVFSVFRLSNLKKTIYCKEVPQKTLENATNGKGIVWVFLPMA